MRRFSLCVLITVFSIHGANNEPAALDGYSPQSSHIEREWETKFRALPSAENEREYMRRLTARPAPRRIALR